MHITTLYPMFPTETVRLTKSSKSPTPYMECTSIVFSQLLTMALEVLWRFFRASSCACLCSASRSALDKLAWIRSHSSADTTATCRPFQRMERKSFFSNCKIELHTPQKTICCWCYKKFSSQSSTLTTRLPATSTLFLHNSFRPDTYHLKDRLHTPIPSSPHLA